MRVDEIEMFADDGVAPIVPPPKRDSGSKKSGEFTGLAISTASFHPSERNARIAIGMGSDSVHRSQFVSADCLVGVSDREVKRILGLTNDFVIYKRSCDSTPVLTRDAVSAEIVPLKVLNQRVHIRWGDANVSSQLCIPVLGTELSAGDAIGVMEGLERNLPAASLEELNKAAERTKLVIVFELGDSDSSNVLAYDLGAYLAPGTRRWKQRCESHTCCLVTQRPYIAHEVEGDIYIVSHVCCGKRL